MVLRLADIYFVALLATGFTASAGTWASSNVVKVGVLAHRGGDVCTSTWESTISYLSEQIQGHEFQLLPLDLDGVFEAVKQGELDFILTNPGNYVDLESRYSVTRIATLRNLRNGNPYTLFGSVIFVRADREDLHTLSDLRNKSFGAVDRAAFGGFQMAWRELKEAGINPFEDFSDLQFLGFPQDNIVLSVRDKKIDGGTVRTDILERMVADREIRLEDFRILNQKDSKDFPFHLSSRLYPEWAFSKTSLTSDKLAEEVAIALLNMADNHPAAVAGKYAGWTVPLNYQPVHELFRDLEIGPYQKIGDISLLKLMKQYWYWLVPIMTAIALIMFHYLLVNRQVALRTRELSKANETLENEVIERRYAEEEARRFVDEKRFLAQKILQVQEDERQLLARELHDELGQCITAIKADAQSIQELSQDYDTRLVTSARAIESVSSRIYEVVHSMMQRLRPSALDSLGFVETLKGEVQAWQLRQPDISYSFNAVGELGNLSDIIQISLIRIIQECLTNIVRHAEATEVVVNLELINDKETPVVYLKVRDNGVGIDQESIGGGFGLIGMQERAEILNGKIEFSANSEKGTTITVILPTSESENKVAH